MGFIMFNLTLITPKMGTLSYTTYSFFTGINLYTGLNCYGIVFGFLGFGIVLEYLKYET